MFLGKIIELNGYISIIMELITRSQILCFQQHSLENKLQPSGKLTHLVGNLKNGWQVMCVFLLVQPGNKKHKNDRSNRWFTFWYFLGARHADWLKLGLQMGPSRIAVVPPSYVFSPKIYLHLPQENMAGAIWGATTTTDTTGSSVWSQIIASSHIISSQANTDKQP